MEAARFAMKLAMKDTKAWQEQRNSMAAKITIPEAVKQLLAIVERLRKTYTKQNRQFTLDGRLVGDIGEILAEAAYDVCLFADQKKHHDAKTSDGRLVQIKATMKDRLTFPVDHTPKYYLGIQIHANGSFTEVFNGPGRIARKAVKDRKATKTNLHSVSLKRLKVLNSKVGPADRIAKRSRSSRR